RAPILIAGGMIDDRTSIVETRRMFARANEPKRLWLVPGARHVDLEGFAPAEYRSHVLAFMVETLRRGRDWIPAGGPPKAGTYTPQRSAVARLIRIMSHGVVMGPCLRGDDSGEVCALLPLIAAPRYTPA